MTVRAGLGPTWPNRGRIFRAVEDSTQMLSPTDDAAYRFDGVSAFLAGLPQDQFSVELHSAQIEKLIGEPLPPEVIDQILSHDSNNALIRSCHRAGFGTSTVKIEIDPGGFVLGLCRGLHKFPGISVDSSDFHKLPADARLRELATGYIESGKILCNQLGNYPGELTWPRMAVAKWCYRHAFELFIKSCILHCGEDVNCGHNFGGMLDQYQRLYPGAEYRFHREPELPDIEKWCGEPIADVEDFERKPDQVLRYSTDKQGRSPKGIYRDSPAGCLSLLEQLERDMARIWGRIQKRGRIQKIG